MSYKLNYKVYGERSVLIEWPQIIDQDILHDVLSFKAMIKAEINQALQVNHAYNSLLLVYPGSNFDFKDKIEVLKTIYKKNEITVKPTFRKWKIPVCYDSSLGMDIKELASTKNLSVKDVIKHHTGAVYTVYFIGFLPGFLYLGGLNELLHTPRKASPRLKVEKGAVAIGGHQTGIYPNDSPGGWNIIGNSPIEFFDVNKESPCFASSGDQIKFYSISKKEHENIKTLIKTGVYQIESEVIVG